MTPRLAADIGAVFAAEADEIAGGPPRSGAWTDARHGVGFDWWQRGQLAARTEASRLHGVAREWFAHADALELVEKELRP